MKKLILFFVGILLFSCNVEENNQKLRKYSIKAYDSDPFKETIVESQYFSFNQIQDTVIEGKNGTVIFIPKDAFLDEEGKIVFENIKIELAEGFSLSDQVNSNFTSEGENGSVIASKGVFFINATANGKRLQINPKSPIHVEMPTSKNKDIKIFNGIRDKKGRMKWYDPRPIVKYLKAIPLDDLDFLPEGFEKEVKRAMPIMGYKKATKHIVDSLYYAFDFNKKDGNKESDKAIEEKDAHEEETDNSETDEYTESEDSSKVKCNGIYPSIIKTIRSKEFENTLIATREFETRLKHIFQTSENDVIEVYIKNLDKNLWKLDEMAAEKLGKQHQLYETFKSYADEKLTKVDNQSLASKKITEFYAKKLKENKRAIAIKRKEYFDAINKRKETAQKVVKEYRSLLKKREKYRMNKFGFELKRPGWYNAGITIYDLERFEVVVKVVNGKKMDRVHTYIVDQRIKSIYAMVSDDKVTFNRGYYDDPNLLLPKNQQADVLVIAYDEKGKTYLAKSSFIATKYNEITVKLRKSNKEAIKHKIGGYKEYKEENSIDVDLAYQNFFKEEQDWLDKQEEEDLFRGVLIYKAFNNCFREFDGKKVFEKNCAQCHAVNEEVVGPKLSGVIDKRGWAWTIKFTKYPQKMIESGDKEAVKLYKKYKQYMPNHDFLSDVEIIAVMDYIEQMSKEK